MSYTREDVIAFVKEIVGDLEAVKPTYLQLQIHRYARSLRVQFTLEGRDILGEYVIPIPEKVIAAAMSQHDNPYNAVRCRVDVGNDDVLPPMAPESSPEGS
jgi:hypothetical protein